MSSPVEVEIIAHRGFSERAPENTLAALRAALEAGADAIEFDLQTASCGTPVLFHDPHLGRTSNGVGPVRRRTLGQLRALDVGSWFSAEFAGERVPTLADALELIAPSEAIVYAEVKGYRELEDLDRMVRIAEESGIAHRVVFISLDFGVVERIAGRSDRVGLGYVVDEASEIEEGIARATAHEGRALVDYDRRLILDDPGVVDRTLAAGAALAVWTVDDPGEATELHAAGVRRFTTNRVTELQRWRAREVRAGS